MPERKYHVTLGEIPQLDELVALYDSVGWVAYTSQPDVLMAGVAGSLLVATARTRDGQLVGSARVVGDGHTIAYLQDILVHPEHQRQGLGCDLLHHVFAPYMHCRQHVLITGTEPQQRAFYEAEGFTLAEEGAPDGVRCFFRFHQTPTNAETA